LKIYILRHGETALNQKGVMQGWLDEPLNESGRFLAAVTGQKLKGIRFRRCFSSPLVRAKETAEIVLRESGNDVPVELDPRIREISFGSLEGQQLEREAAMRFFTDPFSYGRFPGGEGVRDVCERTWDFISGLMKLDDGGDYLVSTHGCALRAMLNRFYDDPLDYWHGHVPYNCVVNIIEAHGGSGKLVADDIIYYDRKYCVDRYALDGK
jgi:broad specificity phosphatase PhoE